MVNCPFPFNQYPGKRELIQSKRSLKNLVNITYTDYQKTNILFKCINLKCIFPFLSGNMSSSLIGSLIVITQPIIATRTSQKKKNERFAFDYVTMPHRKPISYLAGMLPSLSNKMIICSSAGCDNTAQRFVLVKARTVKIGLF